MPDQRSSRAAADHRPTRRRGQDLVNAIHTAALEETAERGLGRLTMEGIARRASTAKTSLYRRWSSPEDIVLEALRRRYPMEQPSATADDLRGDLIKALTLLRDTVTQPLYGPVMQELFEEARRRPELHRRLYEEVYDPQGGRFTRTVLEHYAERGHFDKDRITPVTADIGEAMMIKYSLDNFDVADDDYLAMIVDQVILPAIGRDPRA